MERCNKKRIPAQPDECPEPGETYRQTRGCYEGEVFLACKTRDGIRLFGLADGVIWAGDSATGGDQDFEKVTCCYEVCDD